MNKKSICCALRNAFARMPYQQTCLLFSFYSICSLLFCLFFFTLVYCFFFFLHIMTLKPFHPFFRYLTLVLPAAAAAKEHLHFMCMCVCPCASFCVRSSVLGSAVFVSFYELKKMLFISAAFQLMSFTQLCRMFLQTFAHKAGMLA